MYIYLFLKTISGNLLLAREKMKMYGFTQFPFTDRPGDISGEIRIRSDSMQIEKRIESHQ